ncbi:hypothetical protein D918_03416 [Trichuris suis]|nr:hypothetical protein D918_03416 [Trichuris suis]
MYRRRLPNSRVAVAALRSSDASPAINGIDITNTGASSEQEGAPVEENTNEEAVDSASIPSSPLPNITSSASADLKDLYELLDNCGLTLSLSLEKPSQLSVNNFKFIKCVVKATSNESVAEKLLESFCPLLEDETSLKALMLPSEEQSTKENASSTTDSVVRMLLRVPRLQPSIAQRLFSIGQQFCTQGGDTKNELLEMIINQFRYLECVADNEVLVSCLLNFATVAPSWLLEETFYCISEVVEDEYHDCTGGKLCELMKEKPELTEFVVDTLSCLSLSMDVAIELKEKLSNSIPSMDANQLTSALGFLLQCQSLSDAKTVIFQLRENIVMEKFFKDEVPAIVECAVKFRRYIAEAIAKIYDRKTFLSLIGNVPLQAFDLYLLLLLLMTRYQLPANLIIRVHVREGRVDLQLITEIFRHQTYVKSLVSDLLEFVGEVFEASEENLTQFASAVYSAIFLTCSDMEKENTMTALIGHCTSGNPQVVDAALDLLMSFVSSDIEACLDFDYLLAGLLDLVPRFSLAQMRLCFHIITTVAFFDTQSSTSLMDGLLISIRKFIASSSLKLQTVGIVAIFAIFSAAPGCNDVLEQLLSAISEKIADSHFLAALMYDELAEMTGSHGLLDMAVEHFAQIAKSTVKSLECPRSESGNETILFGNATGAIERLIDFAKLLQVAHETSSNSDEEQYPKALTLCPLIRFLGNYVLSKEEQPNELLDIVGGPFVYVSKNAIGQLGSLSEDLQIRLIRIIFHCANWLREVLNVSMKTKRDSACSLALSRLVVLLSMENDLNICLANTTAKSIDFYSWNYSFQERTSFTSKKQKTRKVKTNPNKRKRKANEEQTAHSDLEASGDDETEHSLESKDSTGPKCTSDKVISVNPSLFREYDIAVFGLLNCDVSFNPTDSLSQQIPVDGLEHLLRDLDRKMESRVLDANKQLWWLKNVDDCVVTKFRQLPNERLQEFLSLVVPLLYKHLEGCRLYLSAFIDSYDGLLDHPHINSKEVATAGRCVELLLSCLHHSYICNSSILKSDVLSDKFMNNEETSEENKVEVTVLYLLQFTDLCRTFSAASRLLQFVQALAASCPSTVMKEAIGSSCLGVLKRHWSLESTWLVFSRHVSYLLNICLWSQDDSNTLEFLEQLALKSIGEALESDSFESTTYQTFRKETLQTWYQFLFVTLREDAKKAERRLSTASTEEKFISWALSVRLFRFLTCSVLPKAHKSSVLRTAIRVAPAYVTAFTNSAIRVLDVNFEEQWDHVRPILQAMQQSTRTLQNMCTQLKKNKDKTLIKFVPTCKRTLEEFVFRVKAVMASHRCLEAMQIANLKTRNLKGEDVLPSSTEEDDSASNSGEDGKSAEEGESKEDEE